MSLEWYITVLYLCTDQGFIGTLYILTELVMPGKSNAKLALK